MPRGGRVVTAVLRRAEGTPLCADTQRTCLKEACISFSDELETRAWVVAAAGVASLGSVAIRSGDLHGARRQPGGVLPLVTGWLSVRLHVRQCTVPRKQAARVRTRTHPARG